MPQRFGHTTSARGSTSGGRRWLPVLLALFWPLIGGAVASAEAAVPSPPETCVAFSPYVAGYNPATGPHPSPTVIARLLDRLIQQTSATCIMTYGVLNGLDATFAAAQSRGLRVTAIIWLDADSAVNDASVAAGIAAALTYPHTIVRVSCGSEVRTRHGTSLDAAITTCISRLRSAGVVQPITSIDTWWQWCNASWPCQPSALSAAVDWIGVNVFPWWENRYSGLFPCTAADAAADFHIARMQDVMTRYPAIPVVLTEFGWPAGPAGYTETNVYTGQHCGIAGRAEQSLVVKSTLATLHDRGWSGTVFQAFKEPWKTVEGSVGPFWGLCGAAPAFRCGLSQLFAKTDLAIDFGAPFGNWLFVDGGLWRPLHSTSADRVVAADLDGGVTRDLVIDFATSAAQWTMLNGATWQPLHPFHASALVRGDLDDDGRDDLLFDFGTGAGTWAYMNGSTWTLFDSRSTRHVLVADVDGSGRDDVIADFGASVGIQVRRNGGAWTPLHPLSAAALTSADLDGDGRSDLVIDFGSPQGIWIWRNDSVWAPLHGTTAKTIAAGDLDGRGRDVLVVDFGSQHGMWTYRDNTGWSQLHPLSATRLVVGAVDGSARADVAIDFGSGIGLWLWSSHVGWRMLHPFSSRALHADEMSR